MQSETIPHTPGPWKVSDIKGAIVSQHKVEEKDANDEWVELYGGHMVAESVAPCNQALIVEAPNLLRDLEGIVNSLSDYEAFRGGCGDNFIKAKETIERIKLAAKEQNK